MEDNLTGWIRGWMDSQMRWVDDGWVDGWIDDGWWMDGWMMDGWIDKPIVGWRIT